MTAASKGRKQQNRKLLGVDKARDELGSIVNRAALEGERTVLTRHGLPAAAVVSIADLERLEGAA